MKNLMLILFVMTAMAFGTNLQAQTACTPAQKAACKKICGDKTTCTPAEIAACKKICASKAGTSTAVAMKVVNKAPSDAASTSTPKATCSKTATATAATNPLNLSPVKLVGLDISADEKKTNCTKTCAKKKE